MAAALAFAATPGRAEDFGDIGVAPQAMYSGNTFHGYAEMRVTLENHSRGRAHNVTLIYPNRSWNNGNCISRLSRTVTLTPGARAIVPLWLPPLPVNGDGSIRVYVDNHEEGTVRAPNSNNHINRYNRSGWSPVVFISRSLDSEAVERVFNANRSGFTAAMATGEPDTSGGGRYQTKTWMPDTREYGKTNWLELDYATPAAGDKVVIYQTYQTMSLPTSGEIQLIGTSGTNLVRLPMSAGKSIPAMPQAKEYSFALTKERIKTVRLDFGTAPPNNIAIDAVGITGPSENAWASDARASSDNSSQATRYYRGGSEENATISLRAELPVPAWSENWLAYTPFDAIVLDGADFNSMPATVFAAIGNYLQAGGSVFIFGRIDLPAGWWSARNKSRDEGVEYCVGLGTCFVSATKNFPALDPKTQQYLRNTVFTAAHYWQTLPDDSGAANAAFSVVENVKIPVRGMVFIMLAFVIAIGPANIILLNWYKRRTWLLWTIPAISLVTTLLVFAYSLLREGVTPDTRISSLTVLDQAGHHATTVGATAFYCPLTPNQGLRFDYETEVTPLVQAGNGRSGQSREVDWSQAQQFRQGWVSARVPAYFHLRKSESRRERLQLENDAGQMAVVNGLGAPIKLLWLADAGGKIYRAGNIAAGQKAGLMVSSRVEATNQLGVGSLFHDAGFTARPETFTNNPEKYLLPGTYIAQLDGNPFVENALGTAASPKRTRTAAVVYGSLDSTVTP